MEIRFAVVLAHAGKGEALTIRPAIPADGRQQHCQSASEHPRWPS